MASVEPAPWSTDCSSPIGMILKLTHSDVEILRTVLSTEKLSLIRQLSRLDGCGYSSDGMQMCRRKSRIERLLGQLVNSLELVAPVTAVPRQFVLARQAREEVA